ncbi:MULTISPECIES: hypothetical protein [Thermocrispum]|uniref:DUF3040 domain-containing protein n=1 Tax=Thermocrispum agreste TaxID=37925 RepID=A0ABD6FH99_9PSEU|nr:MULTISPECIES: hypothetical protein [Thermocrispum]
MTDRDEERLIADALKAKAGHGGGALFRQSSSERVTQELQTVVPDDWSPSVHDAGMRSAGGSASPRWILLLAAALGLAAGAVIGLLTVV